LSWGQQDCGISVGVDSSSKISYEGELVRSMEEGEKYLGPLCPSKILGAKSICNLVTSGGNIAAPGPNLIASSYIMGQLGSWLDSLCRDFIYLL